MAGGLRLEDKASSVARDRRFCEVCLADWGAVDLVATTSLLVSELVTNVVLHARTPCQLRLERGARLRVEVIDGSRQSPVRHHADPDAGSGRGLLLVEALSAESGTILEPTGKRVWFELEWI